METLLGGGHDQVVTTLSQADEIQELTQLFEQVAQEQGWQPGRDIHAHTSASVYFALRRGTSIIGGLQLVRCVESGHLPCMDIWPELQTGVRQDVAYVPILALRREDRGRGNLFWLLCVEMWRYCMGQGISQIYLEVTPPTLRCYIRLGWPLEIVGPLRRHWGEECHLCMMPVGKLADICIARAQNSAVYREIVLRGLHLADDGPLTDSPR